MIKADIRMTIYLAWAVRTALLVLYIPVQILSTIVQSTHRLDLWASAVVMQSARKDGDCNSGHISGEILFAVDQHRSSADIRAGL